MKEFPGTIRKETEGNGVLPIEPLRLVTRIFSKCEEKIFPSLQFVMYSDNVDPDQKRCLSRSMLLMEHFHVMISNYAELYGESDMVSSVSLASYNVEKFITAVAENILKLFGKTGIKIDVNCATDCKCATFDIRRLEIILYNIISNAIVHNPKKDKAVKINAYVKDNNLCITVTDNGRGISSIDAKTILNVSAEDLKSLSLSYNFEAGTIKGLSIYVSKKLANDMNGSITSIPYTKGAKVEIRIPQTTAKRSPLHAEFMEPDSYTLSNVYAVRCMASALIKECFDNVPDNPTLD